MYSSLLNGSRGLRRFAQRWGLIVFVAALLCGGWAFILSSFAGQKQGLLEERQRELAQLNSAVAQHAASLLSLAETDLRTLDAYLRKNRRIDPRRDPELAHLVSVMRRASNGLIELRLVAANGDVFHIPSLDGKPLANVKDEAYFLRQIGAESDRSLMIGLPAVSPATSKWVLPMSWRLESPASGMAMVVAAIELDRLSILHDRMRLKPAGTITLMSTEGTMLSRTPLDHALLGRSLFGSIHYQSEYGVKPRGAFITSNTAVDGVKRLISYERLEDYPVIAMVSEGMQDVLAPHMQRRNLTLMVTVLVTLVILVFTFFLHRFLRALHGAQENLQRLATIDSLTGTLSRRAFLEIAQREFSRALRYGRPTVVIAFDLDKFKRVNDTHGHAVGDAVLREACAAWMTVLRQQDYIGRVGGEEFCAILPETDIAAAALVAERLRQVTQRLRFAGARGEFSVTVSIGLSAITSSDEQVAAVMERADKALYTAKRSGRNRVEVLDASPFHFASASAAA